MSEKNVPAQSWFIKRSSITLICIVLFIFLSGITFFLCYNHYQDNKGAFLKEDRVTARLLSLVLDEHIHMIIKTMESYANRPLLLRAVKNKDAEKAKEHLENMIKNNPDIDILVILDRGGTLWASYPERPKFIGKNFAYREWYKGVSKDWKPHVSDVTLRVVEEKDLAVQISVPFIDDKRETIGILLNTQRVVGLAKIMQQVFVDPGTFTNIIDRKGNIVFSSRFAHEKEVTPYPFYFVKDRLISSKDHSMAVADPFQGGRVRYISYAPVADLGWSVFVGRDSRQVLLSGLSSYIQIGIIAIMLFLMSLLSLVYLRKRVASQQLLDRVRADEGIRKERDQAQMYLDVAGVMIVALNTEGCIVLINEKGCEILGYTEQEITGQNWFNVCLPEEMREELTGVFNKLIAGEITPVEYHENPVLTKDGERRLIAFHNAALRNQSSQITGILFSGEDITERRQAEDALHESEAQLRAILDATPFPIALVDAQDNKIDFWSRSALTLFGHTAPIATEWYQMAYPDHDYQREVIDRWKPSLEIARESRQTVNTGEYRVTCRDGSARICEIYATFLADRLIVTFNDITERKQAEEEIRKLNAELEQRVLDRTAQLEAANKELETFSYSVSHDLRSPLRAIDGFSHILLDEYRDALDERGKDYLDRVRAATQRMGELIDDLLKLSRVSRAEIQHETVDMSSMAHAIAEELHKTHPERHVEFVVADGIVDRGNPQLLRIVFENLFDNACKFTRKNAHARIEFGVTAQKGRPAYYIRDNGVGFEMEFADKIFGVFQRLHAKSEFEGTGIGLATVQRIIHKHGGKIWAEAEVGKGAVFYFTLEKT